MLSITTTFFPLLLLLSLHLSLLPTPTEAFPGHPWRYVFPFFPEELDILIGHLRTTIVRLEEVLEQCEDMLEGEWEGEDSPIGVMQLSGPDDDDSGSDGSMEEKVERIMELREKIGELEDKIEECSEDD